MKRKIGGLFFSVFIFFSFYVSSCFAALSYGEVMAVYKGIEAKSNGSYAGTGMDGWQCVNYVKRFYRDALNFDISEWSGNAKTYYGSAEIKGLDKYPNDGNTSPQPDDLLAFGGGDYGHVAIVTEVGDDYVKIIEQNWSRDSAIRKLGLSKSNGKYLIDDYNTTYYVQGWLRKPGHISDSSSTTEDSSSSSSQDTSSTSSSNNQPTPNTPSTSPFSLNHIGWLDAHSNNPKATHLSSGNFGGSVQGVHLATNSPDQDIYFYGEWNGNQMNQGQAANKLSSIEGKNRQIQDMVSGKFEGGEKEYLAVIYKGSDLVYFYYNYRQIGVLDTHGGRPQANQITAGDVDGDGKDELFVSTTADDHIYMFDNWHYGDMGRTMDKVEHNFLDAHDGNPRISALACMDMDDNGRDELMVATENDDHVYEYFYADKKNWLGNIEEVNFHKQGYVDGASGGAVKEMITGKFKGNDGIRDYLAVLSSGNQNRVYFYWERDLGKTQGGVLSKSGYITTADGKNLIDIAATDINSSSEGEELVLATEGNDHINFYGDIIGEKGGGGDDDFYDAKTILKSNEEVLLRPGQEKELWIEYENTGHATWFEGKNNSPNLITTKPHKRNSIFQINSWPNQWQPTLLSKQVKPGEKYRYKFKIKAPNYSGNYREVFALHNGTENDLYKNSFAGFKIYVDGEAPTKAKNLKGDTDKTIWQQNITRDTTPSFKWGNAYDAHSGMDGYYVSIDDVTPDGSGGIDKFIGNKLAWTVPQELSEGWHTFAVTSKDKVGNVNPENTNKLGDAPYVKFLVDRTPPTQVKNFMADETKSTWVSTGVQSLSSDSFIKSTNDSSPKFTWQKATDNLSGVAGYYLAIDNNSPDGQGDWDYKISNLNSFTLPQDLSEGEHTIYIKSFDKAGNITKDAISYSFVIDKSAPTGSIIINDNTTYTNNLDVELDIEASDLSPIVEYRISSNAKDWRTYSVSGLRNLSSGFSWNLEEIDGTRTVYVQFKDALGHISNAYHDSIYLDMTKPTSWVNDMPTWYNTLRFLVSWHGDDNLSGVKWYDVQYKDSEGETWFDWVKETTLTSKIFEGIDGLTYYFRSRARDSAENQEEYPEEPNTEVTVDITAPDPPIIILPERNAKFSASIDENEELEGVQVTFSGTAEAESRITLTNTEDENQNYAAVTDLDGNWAIANINLVEGENIIEVTAEDAAGNSNTSGDHKYFLDTIRPASISDLVISEVTYHSINLEWSAPGDDENIGTAYEYDIRYSTSEITAENFNSATQVIDPPLPEVVGTHQTLVLDNLEPKETYYVAIRTSDEVANWSGISNIVNEYTPTSANTITLTTSRNEVMAEGRDTVNLEARVLDHEGAIGPKLSGEPVTITITDDNGVAGETGSISAITDNGNGVYTAVYTSATKIGDGQIEITAENPDCATITDVSRNINLIPGNPTGVISLSAAPASLNANGISISTITSNIIRDRTGNIVVNGQEITVSTNLGTITTADQNVGRPGVQILTQDGRIEFQIRSSVWNGYGQANILARVTTRSVLGSAAGDIDVTFQDVTAPNNPHIEVPSDGLITNENRPTITGTAERDSRILIERKQGSGAWTYHYFTNANSSGNFSYRFGSGLADGNWSFRVRSRDAAGNTSGYSNATSIRIDTSNPRITGHGPTGIIYHRTNTIWATYSDTGSGIDTSRTRLRVNGINQSPTSINGGRIEFRNTFANENRDYNVELVVYDRAGNSITERWSFSIQVASFYHSQVDSTYKTSIVADWPYTRGRIPAPNWWDPGFNDSTWSSSVYRANLAPNSVSSPCSDCEWIWGDSHVDPNETTIFRKRFSIPAGVTITDAAIRMSADNEAWGYVGYVNGHYFGEVPEAGSGDNPHTFGLESYLRAGNNLLAVQTSNGDDDRAGFAYTMTIRYHD